MLHNFFTFYTYHPETSYKDSPWVEDLAYWFCGSIGQGHSALIIKNFYAA